MDFDNTLIPFTEIEHEWSGILIGNGASRAIADSFAYPSLFQNACSDVTHTLAEHEKKIFEALDTRNFEQVLSALTTAQLVSKAFNHEIPTLEDSYERIRLALVEAVQAIHIPHAHIPEQTLHHIRTSLLKYDFVYSTNYDLLIYWAIMQDPTDFRDYFFSGSIFNVGDTEVWHKSTKLLFLHGALHLYRTRIGQTFKRTAGQFGNLLDDFGTPIADQNGAVPLFITEGTSTDKLRSIYNSDYLSFAYSQFSRHSGPLVIFGHTLNEQFDNHLISAIRSRRSGILGIGIHPATSGDLAVAQIKALWFNKFHNFELYFFDASTHPLGLPELHVPIDDEFSGDELSGDIVTTHVS
jgi:hypothetical protein